MSISYAQQNTQYNVEVLAPEQTDTNPVRSISNPRFNKTLSLNQIHVITRSKIVVAVVQAVAAG